MAKITMPYSKEQAKECEEVSLNRASWDQRTPRHFFETGESEIEVLQLFDVVHLVIDDRGVVHQHIQEVNRSGLVGRQRRLQGQAQR